MEIRYSQFLQRIFVGSANKATAGRLSAMHTRHTALAAARVQ